MTQPRTSIVPTGTPGTVPSFDPDCPAWQAIRDAEGRVWVHFYAGIWDCLVSKEMADRFEPSQSEAVTA